MDKSTTKKRGASIRRAATQTDAAELQAFAHHFAEVLRIARTSALFPASFYNGLGQVWIEFENDLINAAPVTDSEEFIALALRMGAPKLAARKGGAK